MEAAAAQANAWIKSLRLARVDGVTFRERFTYAGDSLWWFAELYLHKERSVLSIFRTLAAAAAMFDREAPASVRLTSRDPVAELVVRHLAHQRRVPYDGSTPPPVPAHPLGMDLRSTALMAAAIASPARPIRQRPGRQPTVAAFVHRAFWQGAASDGGAEAYIGPALRRLEHSLPARGVAYVGVGPASNFRARRWWTRVAATRPHVTPIEALAPRSAMAGSLGLWAARHAMRRSLEQSPDLRAAAVVGGCDCWPVISRLLAGIALLQFPWSARAMDEARAALETCHASVAVTYAEAGGWGRAIALEARRVQIPLVGLQHGFIYRHWLNYLHEPDEMAAHPRNAHDRGFPRPTSTLVFDAYAARHLVGAGRFPSEAVTVTGSPRLDQLAARYRSLSEADVDAARASAGVPLDAALLLLVTKYSEARGVLADLLDAVRGLPGVHLAIKAHPAETPEPYVRAAVGAPRVRVLSPSTDLAPLIRASRAVVTVNSTVALDAMTLGVPGLSIGLPNNLSPFVAAGALAGARTRDEVAAMLRRLLYDEEFRQQLSAASGAVCAEYRMLPDGRAAGRQAAAILSLAAARGEPRGRDSQDLI